MLSCQRVFSEGEYWL